MISVLGGKITGYRAIAEDVVDTLCRKLGISNRPARTAEMPLPGARPGNPDPLPALDPDTARHLSQLYGTRAGAVWQLTQTDAALKLPLSAQYADIGAQVTFGVRFEHCARLSDFLRRRTLLGASADLGMDAALPAAKLMASALGWSTSRTAAEIDAFRCEVDAARAFRAEV
jgi:glycerol-3-phosphate dehydrogenase